MSQLREQTQDNESEEDTKEDLSEDSKEDLSEDSKEDLSEDSKEDLSEDSKEDLNEDSKEDLSEDSEEDLNEDSEEDLNEDSEEEKEDMDEDLNEASEEEKENLVEELRLELRLEIKLELKLNVGISIQDLCTIEPDTNEGISALDLSTIEPVSNEGISALDLNTIEPDTNEGISALDLSTIEPVSNEGISALDLNTIEPDTNEGISALDLSTIEPVSNEGISALDLNTIEPVSNEGISTEPIELDHSAINPNIDDNEGTTTSLLIKWDEERNYMSDLNIGLSDMDSELASELQGDYDVQDIARDELSGLDAALPEMDDICSSEFQEVPVIQDVLKDELSELDGELSELEDISSYELKETPVIQDMLEDELSELDRKLSEIDDIISSELQEAPIIQELLEVELSELDRELSEIKDISSSDFQDSKITQDIAREEIKDELMELDNESWNIKDMFLNEFVDLSDTQYSIEEDSLEISNVHTKTFRQDYVGEPQIENVYEEGNENEINYDLSIDKNNQEASEQELSEIGKENGEESKEITATTSSTTSTDQKENQENTKEEGQASEQEKENQTETDYNRTGFTDQTLNLKQRLRTEFGGYIDQRKNLDERLRREFGSQVEDREQDFQKDEPEQELSLIGKESGEESKEIIATTSSTDQKENQTDNKESEPTSERNEESQNNNDIKDLEKDSENLNKETEEDVKLEGEESKDLENLEIPKDLFYKRGRNFYCKDVDLLKKLYNNLKSFPSMERYFEKNDLKIFPKYLKLQNFVAETFNTKEEFKTWQKNVYLREVQKIVKRKGGTCLSSKFINSDAKLKFRCKYGHEFELTHRNVKTDHWCPICLENTKKLANLKEFQAIAKKHGGICLSAKYVNNKTKLKFRCKFGHKFEKRPDHAKEAWCPICEKNSRRLKIDIFKAIAKEHGGVCLSENYINNRTKLKFRCKHGHEFEMRPYHVIDGRWCPRNANNRPGTIKEMRRIAKKNNGVCLSAKYINNKTKLKFRCEYGHEFEMAPVDVKNRDHWCPKCAKGLYERICRGVFQEIFGKKFDSKSPDWLKSDKGHPLTYDGYCNELKLALEFQGYQHYLWPNHFHKTKKEFLKQRENDQEKRDLSKEHGVIEIEVPFWIRFKEYQDYIIGKCTEKGINVPQIKYKIDWRKFKRKIDKKKIKKLKEWM